MLWILDGGRKSELLVEEEICGLLKKKFFFIGNLERVNLLKFVIKLYSRYFGFINI